MNLLIRRVTVVAVATLGTAVPALAQNTVLRVVPHSDLAIFDPIWTTAYMSRNHGYMVYDTLFGTDENAKIKPQMDKAAHTKFAKFQPRVEPPSGTTGSNNVYIDRVEWNLALRDVQAQVNALQKGEVDIIKALSFDHFETVKTDTTLQMPKYAKYGLRYTARFNHLHKPFGNAKVRQAVIAAMAQEPFLRAQVGVKDLYRACASMFVCGTPCGSLAGSELQAKSSIKRRKSCSKPGAMTAPPSC